MPIGSFFLRMEGEGTNVHVLKEQEGGIELLNKTKQPFSEGNRKADASFC